MRIITPAGMHILCIVLRYNKPNRSKNLKNPIYCFTLTKLELSFVGFCYFELRNIYISNYVYKNFQYSVVSSFIESGVGATCPLYCLCLIFPSVEQQKQFYS